MMDIASASALRRTSRPTPTAWALRVASRPEVGGGHVRRCQALAAELGRTVPVTFVLDTGGHAWARELGDAGYAVQFDYGARGGWAACLLDGYDFGDDEIAHWRSVAPFLAVIDDLGQPLPSADFVVRTAPHQNTRAPGVAGLAYALIDSQYGAVTPRTQPEVVSEVLVSFGLRDSADGTSLALRALAAMADDGRAAHVTVVLGPDAKHLSRVRETVARLGTRAALRNDLADLRPLLLASDLVIGSGGVGLLERMACGVPSLTVVTADNQLVNAREAERLNATTLLGNVSDCTANMIADAFRRIANDRSLRAAMSDNARRAVDGLGAPRTAAALLAASARFA